LTDLGLFVTGGASGIGLATVRLFELKKAKGIVIVDFRPPSEEILKSLSENVLFVQADVTSWESLSKAFQSAIDKCGTIDYVYANAGIGELDHLFVDKIDERTGQLIAPNYAAIDVKFVSSRFSFWKPAANFLRNVSLKGALSTVKLAVHWFRKQKVPGHIVMTSSMSGYETPGIPIYTSSKVRLSCPDLNYSLCE
jgi:NAD(P)-dependent dehydrogenase (short-subunit alcohol dehydrogenase family)